MGKKMSVMIFDGPYGHEKPYTALRFALTALIDGHDVTVILIQDGIFTGKKAQNPAEYPNHLEYLENAISEGLNVIVCGVCCNARGLSQEDLVKGAKIVGMHEIVEAVSNSDVHVTF
ncbi:MAG: DsrE/DsrF/TusD sulfur relay family protein [Candidatus Helarchaeota archaeon]